MPMIDKPIGQHPNMTVDEYLSTQTLWTRPCRRDRAKAELELATDIEARKFWGRVIKALSLTRF